MDQSPTRHFVAFRDRPKVTFFVSFGSVPKLHFLSLLGQVENNFQDIFILYESNVDRLLEQIYNDDSIPKYTYEDILKYQEIFHPEDNFILQEDSEYYNYNKINNEHDKIFRTILNNTKEAISFINKTLNIQITENELEKYKENYITENLINKETDIVYKIKDDKITNNLIEKLKEKEEKEMLAILDTIAEENERILQQGIKEGIQRTKVNNAKKMKNANLDISLIMEITGLSKKEIENL